MTRRYDNHGRDQINIENFHYTPSITGQELLDKGLCLLKQKSYQAAADVLSNAVKTEPSLSEADYYLAIALLDGKPPRKIDRWTIQKIEKRLNTSIHKDSKPSRCYILLAIVKYGFYSMNGFREKPPSSAQLYTLGESIQIQDAREILYHLNDPSNPYWLSLYRQVRKSI